MMTSKWREDASTEQQAKNQEIWTEENQDGVFIYCDDQQGGQELMCTFEYHKGAKLDAEDICERYNILAGIENPKEAVNGLLEALLDIHSYVNTQQFSSASFKIFSEWCEEALKPWRERGGGG